MDTERIVELILQELAALESSAGTRAHSLPGENPQAAAAFAWEEGKSHGDGVGVEGLVLDARPCREFVRPDKLRACGEDPAHTLKRMQQATSARIGVGKCGARLRTGTVLQFRADHAAAKDAVARDVPQDFLEKLGLFTVQTLCADHDEYLTRPDLGRRFSPETLEELSKRCKHGADVQLYAAGGLSSTAIAANLANILPAVTDGLTAKGLTLGTPFYVRYARVPSMDPISELLRPKVVCVFIGERPGLATAESMSAYIAYQATVDMPESRRTVVSNIHRGGISAAEAGAYIAELIQRMIETRSSGVEFAR